MIQTLKNKSNILLTLFVFSLVQFISLFLIFGNFYNFLEVNLYDLQFIIKKREKPSEGIVIIGIDDFSRQSLKKNISQWRRALYGEAVEKLANFGAELIVFDIDLSQPSIYGEEDDRAFAESIKKAGNVILPVFFTGKGLIKPLSIFEESSLDLGVINLNPDGDGKIRRIQLLYGVLQDDEKTISTISSISFISAVYFLFNDEKEVKKFMESIPLTSASYNINFPGPPGTFPYFHFSDLIDGKIERKNIEGKIVLMGNTSAFYNDFYPVPHSIMWSAFKGKEIASKVRKRMAGVEIHASSIDTLIKRSFIKEKKPSQMFLVIFFFGILTSFLFIFISLKGWLSALLCIIILISLFFLNHYLFLTKGLYFHQLPFHLFTLISFTGGIALHRTLEKKERLFITSVFGKYVSKDVVDQILTNPSLLKLGGEKKELTIMFTDLANFTTLSENMSPHMLTQFMNDYLTEMSHAIFNHRGLVDKYIGDAIMALFGAPISNSTHAEDAVLSALEMKQRLVHFNSRWREKVMSPVLMRIGINTGEVIVGNFGSQMRFDYSVLGDAVNLASRVETYNKVFGTTIMITEFTASLLSKDFILREIDFVKVKGKRFPVRVYEVMGLRGQKEDEVFEEIAGKFEKAVLLFRKREWKKALEIFNQLHEHYGDHPSRVYIERCVEFAKNPPGEDWDGVYEAKTK